MDNQQDVDFKRGVSFQTSSEKADEFEEALVALIESSKQSGGNVIIQVQSTMTSPA